MEKKNNKYVNNTVLQLYCLKMFSDAILVIEYRIYIKLYE